MHIRPSISLLVRIAASAAILGLTVSPLAAQSAASVVTPLPAPPAHHQAPVPYPYPVYPVTSARSGEIRCEQDRLLTDNTPCGPEAAQAQVVGRSADGTLIDVPDKPKRCEQDRLLTDTTPCSR
ncbi:hypothetical protein [Sphingomonas oryzagri]|uniref:Secreted protein n=1 Tax=Sphingomonas oryzagri TaxID=3042314 RepID=A0ABT6MWL2_9SPHN|nr:hypothetical protein [Sphingomonas oryzagri]MDH7637136.1 hypothetical protein [Sphingomonas oryzagri]